MIESRNIHLVMGGIVSEKMNCHVDPIEKPLDREALDTAMIAYLAVWGMGCPRCAMRVRNGLLNQDGVLMADVYLERGIAKAAYDPQQITTDDLVLAVASAGNDGRHHYQAKFIKQEMVRQVMR